MRYTPTYETRRINADSVLRYRVHVLIDRNGTETGYREFFRDKETAIKFVKALSDAMTKDERLNAIIVKEFA